MQKLWCFQTGKTPIKDMFTDLRDGRKLLDLLEGLTGSVLVGFCICALTFVRLFFVLFLFKFDILKKFAVGMHEIQDLISRRSVQAAEMLMKGLAVHAVKL